MSRINYRGSHSSQSIYVFINQVFNRRDTNKRCSNEFILQYTSSILFGQGQEGHIEMRSIREQTNIEEKHFTTVEVRNAMRKTSKVLGPNGKI